MSVLILLLAFIGVSDPAPGPMAAAAAHRSLMAQSDPHQVPAGRLEILQRRLQTMRVRRLLSVLLPRLHVWYNVRFPHTVWSRLDRLGGAVSSSSEFGLLFRWDLSGLKGSSRERRLELRLMRARLDAHTRRLRQRRQP